MDENQEELEPHKNQEGESEPEVDKEYTPEEIAELKKKAEASSQNFERAKKAEAELKKLKGEGAPEVTKVEGLSQKDLIAIAKSDIHEDDIDEVLEHAKFKKIPVSEALRSPYIKSYLGQRSEERATAEATQTKSPRGSSKFSGESLIEKARQGKLPESDEDIARLADARMAERLKNKK